MIFGYLKTKICAIIFGAIVTQSTIVEHQVVRVIQFEIAFTFVTDMIILIPLITLWSIVFQLEDDAQTIVKHFFSLSIGSLTCLPLGRSISSSNFFTQPHLQTPMATSLFLLSVKTAFLIAWPTTWTTPTLYPSVISQASTWIEIRWVRSSLKGCLPDDRATSVIPLIKFDSSRSARTKYLAPPRNEIIKRGLRILQESKRICSALLSGVSKARRAN